LQHADNPVDWYPWGPEAFEKAHKENKPIFLSIGYSTCHWCHVMAHESFEDPEVARLMNDAFVSIKVDREERPDIDNIYMTVCQMMTGSGGWPLTIIMTPDKSPFFATTYIPRESRFGRMGMLELIPRIVEMWSSQRNESLRLADHIASELQKLSSMGPGDALDDSILHRAYTELEQSFDERYAGFGDAPKFPTPHNLLFLLRYWKRTGNDRALEMVGRTLTALRQGGIYDHVGFGFHRYSVDSQWHVPHFEKMLYDQALLAIAYTEGFQVTGKEIYRQTAREIFAYVTRDMTAPEGGFYSAEDADSEGEEGKFYLWTLDEIETFLGKEEAKAVVKVFNIGRGGNFIDQATGKRTGANVLHVQKPIPDHALDLKTNEQELLERIEGARVKLFTHRRERVRPHKDDKILADWNGLMIAAFAKGAQVFGDSIYIDTARKAADFIIRNMRTSDARLLHRYRDGQATIPAYLDDYAFLIWGLLELYEATFDVTYLNVAVDLHADMIEHFWDEESGGFYFTADDAESLLVRQKRIYDGAVPSGNSVAMLNLLRLGRMTARTDLEEKAERIGRAFSRSVMQAPSAYAQLMSAVDFGQGPSYEVIIVGDSQADGTRTMINALMSRFQPNKVVLLKPTEQKMPDIVRVAPFVQTYTSIDNKTTAYVCLNYQCTLPTTDVREMLKICC
jgi:uncharacterized protein YyaL (SSP411 family)